MDQFQFNDAIDTEIFTYYPPLSIVRGFISIPNSGLIIPDEFRPYMVEDLSQKDINCDVDYAVDQLVDITALQEAGIAVLVAKVHRICVDLNRAEDIAVLSWKENTQGVKIIEIIPEIEIITKLSEKYYQPYFNFMAQIVTNIQDIKLGFISLLDLHSMPSKPTSYHLQKNPDQSTDRRKDFCLSNLDGLSCQRIYIQSYKDSLSDSGEYTVAINDPYLGGYITQFMDEKFRGNVLQCEINRDTYMSENEQILLPEKIKELKPLLTSTIVNIYIAFNTPFVQNQRGIEAEGYEKDEIDSQFAFSF